MGTEMYGVVRSGTDEYGWVRMGTEMFMQKVCRLFPPLSVLIRITPYNPPRTKWHFALRQPPPGLHLTNPHLCCMLYCLQTGVFYE